MQYHYDFQKIDLPMPEDQYIRVYEGLKELTEQVCQYPKSFSTWSSLQPLFQNAKNNFETAISLDTKDPNSYIRFARFYENCNKQEDAIEVLIRGLQMCRNIERRPFEREKDILLQLQSLLKKYPQSHRIISNLIDEL